MANNVDRKSVFSCRIFHCEYYLSTPLDNFDVSFSEFRGKPVKYCPVIRLFGSTACGRKSCVHIHGVFPYLLIGLDGQKATVTHQYLRYLTKSIDLALQVSFGASRDASYVFKITLVEAMSIYGYHNHNKVFLKVFLYNPSLIKRLADLLLSGAILNQVLQPYEAHVPYILQFLIDYNLHGMNYIHLQAYKRRRPQEIQTSPISSVESSDPHTYHDVPSVSVCELEIDAVAADILNPNVEHNACSKNPGISDLWEEERKRRERLHCDQEDLTPPLSADRECHYLLPREQEMLTELHTLLEVNVPGSKWETTDSLTLSSRAEVDCVVPTDESAADVNESIIHQTMELSQRLSNEAISKSSSEDLLTLLLQLAASQASVSEHKETSAISSMQTSSIGDLLSQSLHDSAVSSTSASNNISLFSDSQFVPEMVKAVNYLSPDKPAAVDQINFMEFEYSPVLEGTMLSNTPQIAGQLSNPGSNAVAPPCTLPSQTPSTPDTPKRKADKSVLDDFTLLNDSCLASLLNSSDLSPDKLSQFHDPNPVEGENILECIVQGQEDEVESFLMSQRVWNEDAEWCFTAESPEVSSKSTLPQLDGSNSESKGKTKKSLSVKKRRLGTARHHPKVKTSMKDQMLCEKGEYFRNEDKAINLPSSHLVAPPQCEVPIATGHSDSGKEEKDQDPTPLVTRKRPAPVQNQEGCNSFVDLSSVRACQCYEQPTTSPTVATGGESSLLQVSGDPMHGEFLWKLLSTTVSKERGAEIREILDSIDQSPTDGESGLDCPKMSPSDVVSKEYTLAQQDAISSLVCIKPANAPPSYKELLATGQRVPVCQHQEPFYSNCQDRQESMNVGNLTLQVSVNLASEFKEFKPICSEDSPCNNLAASGIQHWSVVFNFLVPNSSTSREGSSNLIVLSPAIPPPSFKQCVHSKSVGKPDPLSCQKTKNPSPMSPPSNDTLLIDGPTPGNPFGFKLTPATSSTEDSQIYGEECSRQNLYLTTMSVELHVQTCKRKMPDPEVDPIMSVFYFMCGNSSNASKHKIPKLGIISLSSSDSDEVHNHENFTGCVPGDVDVLRVSSEKELVLSVCSVIEHYNPDILVGYEIQQSSWGYLNERASFLDLNFCHLLSRTPGLKDKIGNGDRVSTDTKRPPELHVVGRCILNLWRLLRHEISLNVYTFENVAYHVLHRRLPHFSFETLTKWYKSSVPHLRWQVVDYYLQRCTANIEILEKFNIIGRTSEFAKLYGILFSEVLSRGSQFRVESILLRLAHARGFVALSPGIQQRARMAAPECLPLILEPESRFYTDPVVVLDFQSLYPSIIIAHNYCFSTCLGRMQHVGNLTEEYRLGVSSMPLPSNTLQLIKEDLVTISPNGVVFVKEAVRKGLIPEMLQEILDTRVMVKKSMKIYKNKKKLEKILDARQLGLKLIANVTYGYTGAHFSGRMPCVEVADSIVAKARETLDQAIRLVNSTEKWGARVVYGDTDSMFVLLKGASKEQAFKIGKEIVDQVTAMNPKPVKLKFEKVYLPCVLQTKKRYVGFMYESLDQCDPIFDAKGIETVRRDTCPAVAKILEKSIKLLFTTKDVSNCKTYIQNQLRKLLEERVALSDYIFAKEYRGEHSYRPGACVPALTLARQALTVDKRAEPRVGERVPYVVIYGTPGLPLIRLIRRPEEYLSNRGLRLNATYYATKQILPALNRVFSLLGLNVFTWYREISRVSRANVHSTNSKIKGTLGDYFASMHCPLCGTLTGESVCENCTKDDQALVVKSLCIIRKTQKKLAELNLICQTCCSDTDIAVTQSCSALFCPVFNKSSSTLRTLHTTRLESVLRTQEQW